jgi:hypothetical protein
VFRQRGQLDEVQLGNGGMLITRVRGMLMGYVEALAVGCPANDADVLLTVAE